MCHGDNTAFVENFSHQDLNPRSSSRSSDALLLLQIDIWPDVDLAISEAQEQIANANQVSKLFTLAVCCFVYEAECCLLTLLAYDMRLYCFPLLCHDVLVQCYVMEHKTVYTKSLYRHTIP